MWRWSGKHLSSFLPHLAGPGLSLILVLALNLMFTRGFLEIEIRDGRLFGSMIDVLDRAAPVMLVSIGMTLVIATRGVDLSVGAVMAIAGAMAAGLVARPEYSILSNIDVGNSLTIVLLCALGVSALAGTANGVMVSMGGIQPIVATLILMVAGRGIAQLLTDGQIVTFDSSALAYLGNGFFLGLPVSISIVAIAFISILLLTRATALGLFVAALGVNPEASRHVGIPAVSVKIIVYALCGLLAGLAGLIVAADIRAADAINCGLYVELDAILAVVLGGTALTGGRFSLVGSLIGALLIQSVTTMILSQGVAVEYTLIVKSAIIIVVCLIQSKQFRAAIGRLVRRRST